MSNNLYTIAAEKALKDISGVEVSNIYKQAVEYTNAVYFYNERHQVAKVVFSISAMKRILPSLLIQ